MPDVDELLRSIRHKLSVLVWATVVLYVVVVAIGTLTYFNAAENHAALCDLRADVQQREQSSKDFLRQHPNGTQGIPAATIQTSIDGYHRTVVALSNLDCS